MYVHVDKESICVMCRTAQLKLNFQHFEREAKIRPAFLYPQVSRSAVATPYIGMEQF